MLTILVKGRRADALQAAQRRGIPLIATKTVNITTDSPMCRAFVADSYAEQLARWFTETPEPAPYPFGTLLHYCDVTVPIDFVEAVAEATRYAIGMLDNDSEEHRYLLEEEADSAASQERHPKFSNIRDRGLEVLKALQSLVQR